MFSTTLDKWIWIDSAHSHKAEGDGGQATFFKTGSFTRDLTLAAGNQAVTGVGFVPKVLIIFASVVNTHRASWGMDDASGPNCIYDVHITTNDSYNAAAFVIYLHEGAGVFSTGVVASFDADGFTITWAKSGAPGASTGNMKYIAIR